MRGWKSELVLEPRHTFDFCLTLAFASPGGAASAGDKAGLDLTTEATAVNKPPRPGRSSECGIAFQFS